MHVKTISRILYMCGVATIWTSIKFPKSIRRNVLYYGLIKLRQCLNTQKETLWLEDDCSTHESPTLKTRLKQHHAQYEQCLCKSLINYTIFQIQNFNLNSLISKKRFDSLATCRYLNHNSKKWSWLQWHPPWSPWSLLGQPLKPRPGMIEKLGCAEAVHRCQCSLTRVVYTVNTNKSLT